MPYNLDLANKVRSMLQHLPNIEEKPMMGGLTFMLNGKMCVGVIKSELMCRIDPAMHELAISKEGCRTMDFTKRLMKGYIILNEDGLKNKLNFEYFINLAIEFNPKAKASKRKPIA